MSLHHFFFFCSIWAPCRGSIVHPLQPKCYHSVSEHVEPLTPPVFKECQDEGVPCTSPPHAACSRSASHLFWNKLAALALHVLKRIRQEATKSRGPQLQHFLSQMKFSPRACFNGTSDYYIIFVFPAEQNRCETLFFFWCKNKLVS